MRGESLCDALCSKRVILKQRIRQLKAKLHSGSMTLPTTPPPPTPLPPTSKPNPTRKKYERVPQLDTSRLPRYEKVFQTWYHHIVGPGKRQQNAKQHVTHVRQWMLFMMDTTVPEMTLSFLKDRERLREWVETLKKHAVTTKLIIIGNVRCFIKFLLNG